VAADSDPKSPFPQTDGPNAKTRHFLPRGALTIACHSVQDHPKNCIGDCGDIGVAGFRILCVLESVLHGDPQTTARHESRVQTPKI